MKFGKFKNLPNTSIFILKKTPFRVMTQIIRKRSQQLPFSQSKSGIKYQWKQMD